MLIQNLMRRTNSVRIATVIFVFLGCVIPVVAHTDRPLTVDQAWHHWNFEPLVTFGLLITIILYIRGLRTLWLHAGKGRGVSLLQLTCFSGGIFTLFIAISSPLDALSKVAFTPHMLQHLLLLIVAPPLLVYGKPQLVMLWAFPLKWRRVLGHRFAISFNPPLIWILHTVLIWIWHVPSLYQAALEYEIIHAFEHLCFLTIAVLYWHSLFNRRRYGFNILSLFGTMMQTTLLGMLMTFASEIWYPVYEQGIAMQGFTPLEDQQLAGILMWLPMGIVYTVVAAVVLNQWLGKEER